MVIIRKLWDFLLSAQKFILFLSSIAIVLGISLQVFFRYVLEINLFGMEEVIIIFAFWLYFIGASYGTYEKSHISADIVTVYIKNKSLQAIMKMIVSIITLILCLLFTYWSVDFFMWGIEQGATSTSLHIPMTIPQSSIFIGFILMSFYLIVHFIQDLMNLFLSSR